MFVDLNGCWDIVYLAAALVTIVVFFVRIPWEPTNTGAAPAEHTRHVQSGVKNSSIDMKIHATNATTGTNAHTNGRANWRAARQGTVISPHATTTTAGAAERPRSAATAKPPADNRKTTAAGPR